MSTNESLYDISQRDVPSATSMYLLRKYNNESFSSFFIDMFSIKPGAIGEMIVTLSLGRLYLTKNLNCTLAIHPNEFFERGNSYPDLKSGLFDNSTIVLSGNKKKCIRE